MAAIIAHRIPKYSSVSGVPQGGLRLAIFMEQYKTIGAEQHLVVDDVLTTGRSILAEMEKYPDSIGYAVFARGPIPGRVGALWTALNL